VHFIVFIKTFSGNQNDHTNIAEKSAWTGETKKVLSSVSRKIYLYDLMATERAFWLMFCEYHIDLIGGR
jgi:hypothetical protein